MGTSMQEVINIKGNLISKAEKGGNIIQANYCLIQTSFKTLDWKRNWNFQLFYFIIIFCLVLRREPGTRETGRLTIYNCVVV